MLLEDFCPPQNELWLVSATCLSPASGIEHGVNKDIATAATAAGLVVGVAGVTATFASGPAAPVVAAATTVTGAVLGGVAAGSWVADFIDENRSPDNLYIKINGKKRWPKNKDYIDVKALDVKKLNLLIGNVPGTHYVELFDYDKVSGDDSFGKLELKQLGDDAIVDNFEVYYQCKEEDSFYVLKFEIKEKPIIE
jgi:hypothetical protein